MSVVVFQHDPNEDAGRLGQVLRDDGHRLRVIRLDQGQALPPDLDDVDGLISMGGPMSVDQTATYSWLDGEMELIRQAHQRQKPIIGICLGAQLIAKALGGEVGSMTAPEIGWLPIQMAFPGTIETILSGIPWNSVQFHLHEQEVTKLPEAGVPLAGSSACRNQAFKVGMRTFAFQYHFEWTREDIEHVIKTPFVQKHVPDPQSLLTSLKQHYEGYRRLGDRLARNIAQYLIPLDKR